MTGRVFRIMVAVPFALIPLAVIAGNSVSFEKMVLKPSELAVLEYSSPAEEENAVIASEGQTLSAKMAKFNPFRAEEDKTGALDQSHNQPIEGQLRVTLTVLNAGGNMAVINDKLLREGDSIRGLRVKRIENNRVLMIDRQSVLSYLEGPK
ncbi:MAG: hypothetical protein IT362_09600 [Deltaproteobacteria bacterium]|nr:hypothetical protein [Deltaproteobacteria bacterium]